MPWFQLLSDWRQKNAGGRALPFAAAGHVFWALLLEATSMSVALLSDLLLSGCGYCPAVIISRAGRPDLLLLSSFRLEVVEQHPSFKRETPDSIPSRHAYVSVSPQGVPCFAV